MTPRRARPVEAARRSVDIWLQWKFVRRLERMADALDIGVADLLKHAIRTQCKTIFGPGGGAGK